MLLPVKHGDEDIDVPEEIPQAYFAPDGQVHIFDFIPALTAVIAGM